MRLAGGRPWVGKRKPPRGNSCQSATTQSSSFPAFRWPSRQVGEPQLDPFPVLIAQPPLSHPASAPLDVDPRTMKADLPCKCQHRAGSLSPQSRVSGVPSEAPGGYSSLPRLLIPNASCGEIASVLNSCRHCSGRAALLSPIRPPCSSLPHVQVHLLRCPVVPGHLWSAPPPAGIPRPATTPESGLGSPTAPRQRCPLFGSPPGSPCRREQLPGRPAPSPSARPEPLLAPKSSSAVLRPARSAARPAPRLGPHHLRKSTLQTSFAPARSLGQPPACATRVRRGSVSLAFQHSRKLLSLLNLLPARCSRWYSSPDCTRPPSVWDAPASAKPNLHTTSSRTAWCACPCGPPALLPKPTSPCSPQTVHATWPHPVFQLIPYSSTALQKLGGSSAFILHSSPLSLGSPAKAAERRCARLHGHCGSPALQTCALSPCIEPGPPRLTT